MVAAALLIASLFVAQSAPSSPAATFTMHDFTPDFWRFWDAAQNQPVEQQAQLWQELQHELFHRYHRQFFDFEGSSGYPLWTTLWAEGMASCVAELLNPSASEIDLSQVPLGMVLTMAHWSQAEAKPRVHAALKRMSAAP